MWLPSSVEPWRWDEHSSAHGYRPANTPTTISINAKGFLMEVALRFLDVRQVLRGHTQTPQNAAAHAQRGELSTSINRCDHRPQTIDHFVTE